MVKNAIVGQSGGPTAVINSSLAGVFEAAQARGVKTVYGMLHGVQGLLQHQYIDLSKLFCSQLDLELLKRTPSSYLGSCRYKLPHFEQDLGVFQTLFHLFDKLNIGYFFYIGGNDSMDTVLKLSAYAKHIRSDIRMIGIPKTIDNDLQQTDHTPGFGSAAKYIATTIKEVIRDGLVYDRPGVAVVEMMGRNAGWLVAASALAKGEDCEGVDMICLPEVPFVLEDFLQRVALLKQKKNSIVIAVSEGVRLKDGRYVCELADNVAFIDPFGHRNLTGTAQYLANQIAIHIPTRTRAIELSTLQRSAAHITSRIDITEAFQVGGAGVKAAFEGIHAHMVGLKRLSDNPYQVTTQLVPVTDVANMEKKVPLEWIDTKEFGVKDDYLNYVKPLIQAELTPMFVDGLPRHIVRPPLTK